MTNPQQHSVKITKNISIPKGINKCLVCAPGMLWVEGIVWSGTGHTVREF